MSKQVSKLDGFSTVSRIIYYLTEYQSNIAYEMAYFDKTNDEQLYQRWKDQYDEISEIVNELLESKKQTNKIFKQIMNELQAHDPIDKEESSRKD